MKYFSSTQFGFWAQCLTFLFLAIGCTDKSAIKGVTHSCTDSGATPSNEQCDGKDNDCDGYIDEGIVDQVINCGEGICVAQGIERCERGTLLKICTPGLPDDEETCNGLDDDCDGMVDEEIEETPIDCVFQGCPSQGRRVCEQGSFVDVCDQVEPIDEQCNNLDDDCDGKIDEDLPKEPSQCGTGACFSTGEVSCTEGRYQDSCSPGNPEEAETCNGLDDDCDGQVDEGIERIDVSCSVGACKRSIVNQCVDGSFTRNECVPGDPVEETCNGIDDDCDGEVDETWPGKGEQCGGFDRDEGRIFKGERYCDNGELSECQCPPGGLQNEEIPNGCDDDNDGWVDDTTCVINSERECAQTFRGRWELFAPVVIRGDLPNPWSEQNRVIEVDVDVIATHLICPLEGIEVPIVGDSCSLDGSDENEDGIVRCAPECWDLGADENGDGFWQVDEEPPSFDPEQDEGISRSPDPRLECRPRWFQYAELEVCDGIDNDFDCIIDEDTVPRNVRCEGIGFWECRRGQLVCRQF